MTKTSNVEALGKLEFDMYHKLNWQECRVCKKERAKLQEDGFCYLCYQIERLKILRSENKDIGYFEPRTSKFKEKEKIDKSDYSKCVECGKPVSNKCNFSLLCFECESIICSEWFAESENIVMIERAIRKEKGRISEIYKTIERRT